MRYEWAGPGFRLVDPDELDELADDGNDARDWGLAFETGSNGCMVYGSLDGLRDMAWRILAEIPHVAPPSTRVGIENTYTCGRVSAAEHDVRGPAAGEALDDWWENVVQPLTGDGHPCGSSEHAHYVATVLVADDPELTAGDSRTWEG